MSKDKNGRPPGSTGRATLKKLEEEVKKLNGHLTALAPEGETVDLYLASYPGMKLRLWSTPKSCTSLHHTLGSTKAEAMQSLEGMNFSALTARRIMQGM